MRSGLGLGFAFILVGCTSAAPDHRLPGATFTPHLDSAPASVACGDDIALYGDPSPDLRYTFAYDGSGLVSHAEGVYTAGGADDTIDYTWGAGGLTHLLETRGWGDARYEITAAYDGANDLVDYAWDAAAGSEHDHWDYALSGFVGTNQPAREVITEQGQPSFGYTLAYDATGRLVSATPDSGPATTWTYDDEARTITADTGNGAFDDVISYDDQDRELSDVWGGSDPSAIAGEEDYAWQGDRLDTMTYRSGSQEAPQTLTTVEVDTMRYGCSMARAARGTALRFDARASARVHRLGR